MYRLPCSGHIKDDLRPYGGIGSHNRCRIAITEHAVYIFADIKDRPRCRLCEVMCYKLSEQPCYDTEHRKDTHRETHPEGNFLNILVFLRQLPEEHRLAYFYKRSERQNRCYKRDYRRKQEAYVSALDRLLVCRLIDHPFGGKAVERRYTADRKSAYQEQDCRVRHPLGKPAELVQVRGSRLLEHRTGRKEEETFEQSVVHCVIKAR